MILSIGVCFGNWSELCTFNLLWCMQLHRSMLEGAITHFSVITGLFLIHSKLEQMVNTFLITYRNFQ